jgi:hypothetical protein
MRTLAHWRRCPLCGAESMSLETCPLGCREPELHPSLPKAPMRLWLLERRDNGVAFFPPNHFRPPKRKRA